MENSRIRLLLLDFDGTLADTRRANTLSYVAALGEAGHALTEEEYAANYFGMRCDEFLTRFGIADPAERERLRLRKIALYPTFFDTVMRHLGIGGPATEGEVSGRDSRSAGTYPAASEPDCRSDETDPAAPLGRVDGILSGADVERPKPAPDCFLEAMRREGCTPRETLIFEDSPIGIEAARRSGASYFVVKL